MGKPNQLKPKLFYHGISLDRRIPQDHPLRKIKQLVDFNLIRSKVAKLRLCGLQLTADYSYLLIYLAKDLTSTKPEPGFF